jgi:hypothetical protein
MFLSRSKRKRGILKLAKKSCETAEKSTSRTGRSGWETFRFRSLRHFRLQCRTHAELLLFTHSERPVQHVALLHAGREKIKTAQMCVKGLNRGPEFPTKENTDTHTFAVRNLDPIFEQCWDLGRILNGASLAGPASGFRPIVMALPRR